MQFLNRFDALITGAKKLIRCQPASSECRIQVFNTFPHGPSWCELKHSGELVTINPVTSTVRTSTGCIGDPASRDGVADHFSQIANLVVFARTANVQGLVVHKLARRFEDRQKSQTDILNMDEGSPWRAVAHDEDLAGCKGVARQIIDDNVAAKPR